METQKCKEKDVRKKGFLDPASINEAMIRFKSIIEAVSKPFLDMQDKTYIRLSYNHQYICL
jgi:hypothetical protein